MGGSADLCGNLDPPDPMHESREEGPVTRRSLLAWLGRATVAGLFSPFIDACVRNAGPASPVDRGGLPDLPSTGDPGLDPGWEPGEDAPEDGTPDDRLHPDAAEEYESADPATGIDEREPPDAGADDAPDNPAPTCDPPFAPGKEDLPVFTGWGERTVDRQEIEALLATWRLTIGGFVDHPLTFDFCQLRDLGVVDQVTDFHCVEGWSVLDVPWNGVPLSRLMDLAGVQARARYLTFTSVGGRYTESLPVDVAREPRSLLALGIGGNTLSLKHGFPARVVVPRLFGYKNPKFVTRIDAWDVEHVGFWPKVGYPVAGEVQPSRLRDGKY